MDWYSPIKDAEMLSPIPPRDDSLKEKLRYKADVESRIESPGDWGGRGEEPPYEPAYVPEDVLEEEVVEKKSEIELMRMTKLELRTYAYSGFNLVLKLNSSVENLIEQILEEQKKKGNEVSS